MREALMNTTLTSTDFAALSPLLILLGGALLMLLLETFAEHISKKIAFACAAIVIFIAIIAAYYAPVSNSILLTPWLRFDLLARFFTIFSLSIGLACCFLASAFFQYFKATHGEYYFLLLASLFGLVLIGASADFLILFLGLETLSLALYVLCNYMKSWRASHEAAMKYFLMGALAAAFLLYGIALVYGAVGTTRFEALLGGYREISTATHKVLFLGGVAFITIGLAFKATIVPFHFWSPDVYDGAPTPVTAYMAVGAKVGAFAAFIRVFFDALPNFNLLWNEGFSILVYPTLIYANYVALRQVQLRRFLAYSGISHAGFLMIPLIAGTPDALSSLLFYLVVYAFSTLGAFAVLAFLDQHHVGVVFKDLRGLFYRSPFLAVILALCLLTLAGIPPTVGFLAKFYVFKVAFEAGYYPLVIVGLLISIISAFYYLRIVTMMFTASDEEPAAVRHSWPAAIVGLACTAAIIAFSIYPTPFMHLLASIKG